MRSRAGLGYAAVFEPVFGAAALGSLPEEGPTVGMHNFIAVLAGALIPVGSARVLVRTDTVIRRAPTRVLDSHGCG